MKKKYNQKQALALKCGVALFSAYACIGLTTDLRAQERLSLEECRDLAKRNSRLIQQKEQDIKAASEQRKDVMTKFFPQVSARGIYLHMEKEFKLINWDQMLGAYNFAIPDRLRSFGTVDLRNVWVGNVSAIQPIFLGGKLTSAYQIASLAEHLQTEIKHTTEVEVENKVDETYWQVISLRSKEQLLQQLVLLLEQTIKDVDAAIEAGVATKADGLSVRTKLSEASVKQSEVENGLQLSRMLLADLCGISEETDFILVDEDFTALADNTSSLPSLAEAHIPEAIERRSEVRSLRLVDSIYAKRVTMETATLSPKLYGFASYSMTNPNSFNGSQKKFGGQYYLGLMMEVPISDIFSGTYKRRKAQAERRGKQIELNEARSKISLQMKQALRKAEDARKAHTAALKAVEMAKENLRYAEVGYREGVIPLLNYTMAQTAWIEAQDKMIDTQIQLRLSDSKLKNILAL